MLSRMQDLSLHNTLKLSVYYVAWHLKLQLGLPIVKLQFSCKPNVLMPRIGSFCAVGEGLTFRIKIWYHVVP